MINLYIFVVLLSALFLGSYEVLKKVSLKKSSVYEVLFFYCLSAFVVSLIFINRALAISFVDILFILLKSSVIIINWLIVLKAMKKLDVGIVVPFSLISTILVVFGSWLFFNESITWIHWASLAFIATGVILITLLDKKDAEKKNEKNHYGYLGLLLIGAVLSTCSALLDKYIINVRKVDSNAVLVWFMFFNALAYGVIYFIKNKRIEYKKLRDNYWMVLTGVCIALADMSYYYSITMDGSQLSLISILRKSSVVVATILASVFLKEKNLLKKLGVLLIMLIGVALPLIFK